MKPRESSSRLALSSSGVGALVQRDYWAVIARCQLRPSELSDWIAHRFAEFAPADRAIFSGSENRSLEVGDRLNVRIPFAGTCGVRVLHRDRNSLTLGTIEGHPEAGRITFGAYRNEPGDVIFHIRSRARSGSLKFLAGFLAIGDPMQLHTWTDFVNNVAISVGTGVIGFIHAESRILPRAFHEEAEASSPTFIARGD